MLLQHSSGLATFLTDIMPGVKNPIRAPVEVPKELMRFGKHNPRYRHHKDYISPEPTRKPYFTTPKLATPVKCDVVRPFRPKIQVIHCRRDAAIDELPLPKSEITSKKPQNGISMLREQVAELQAQLTDKDEQLRGNDHEIEVMASAKLQLHHEIRGLLKRALDAEHALECNLKKQQCQGKTIPRLQQRARKGELSL